MTYITKPSEHDQQPTSAGATERWDLHKTQLQKDKNIPMHTMGREQWFDKRRAIHVHRVSGRRARNSQDNLASTPVPQAGGDIWRVVLGDTDSWQRIQEQLDILMAKSGWKADSAEGYLSLQRTWVWHSSEDKVGVALEWCFWRNRTAAWN